MEFLSKLRALTLGASHDLLNKAIDLNSPSILRQYVRDLEGAIDKMKSESAIQDGQLRTSQREQSDLAASIESDKALIAKLLASTDPNGPVLAKAKAALVIQNQSHLSSIAENIESQKNVATGMRSAVMQLEAKHDSMVSRVRDLERMDRDSKAKEQAATAITQAGKISNFGDNAGVDDLQDRMARRNDVASAKFDQAMGGVHTDTPDDAAVNDLLASLTATKTA